MSTPGGVQYIGGYQEYIGGYSVHQRDTMISCLRRGDIMSTSRDVQYIGVFNRNLKDFINLHHDSCHGTEHPPMYS